MEPAFPQTDSRQTERQRERQGNVVDGSEQELLQHRAALQQMEAAEERKAKAEDTDATNRPCAPPEFNSDT